MKKYVISISIAAAFVLAGIAFFFVGMSDNGTKEKKAYEPGVIESGHYENKWIGVQCSAPDGFYMYTREELEQRSEDAQDTDKGAKKRDLSLDMYMVSDTMDFAQITVESRKDSQETAEKYIEELRDGMLENNGASMQFKDNGSISKESFAGKEYVCLKLEYTLDDLNMCDEIYVRIIDDCVVTVRFNYDPQDMPQRDLMYEAVKKL